MAKHETPRVKLPPIEQIGIVVNDVDRTIEYYGSVFGLGPFDVREVELKGFTYKHRQCDCRLKVAFARSGPVEIELIQVLEGETPHGDFLREKGEGLQHLRFMVDDCAGMLAELAKEGIEPVWHRGVPVFAYLNTDKVGGVVFELVQARKDEGTKT
jgi:methylmalonyl-CoA/ethylmalonyl-CoA epimerase